MNVSRANLIMQLQAHYARWLASAIEHNLGKVEVEHIRRHAAGKHTDAARADYLMQCIELAFRSVSRHADEYRRIISGAREVPDEKLDTYMRHHTLAQWNRLMEEAGFEWDDASTEWRERAEV